MPLNCDPSEKPELACVFAALVLSDEKLPVTAENIQKLLTASKVEVEPYWPKLFASLLEGKDVSTMLTASGGGGGGAAPAAGGAASPSKAAGGKPAEKKEEPKKESSSESGADMGFSLFD